MITISETEQLTLIAPKLDALFLKNDAKCGYELMADALVWSDEVPHEAYDNPELYSVMRYLFRYRTTIILSQPAIRFQVLWELAEQLCPKWPGLIISRRSTSLGEVFVKLRAE